jgi:hypothetical protein
MTRFRQRRCGDPGACRCHGRGDQRRVLDQHLDGGSGCACPIHQQCGGYAAFLHGDVVDSQHGVFVRGCGDFRCTCGYRSALVAANDGGRRRRKHARVICRWRRCEGCGRQRRLCGCRRQRNLPRPFLDRRDVANNHDAAAKLGRAPCLHLIHCPLCFDPCAPREGGDKRASGREHIDLDIVVLSERTNIARADDIDAGSLLTKRAMAHLSVEHV